MGTLKNRTFAPNIKVDMVLPGKPLKTKTPTCVGPGKAKERGKAVGNTPGARKENDGDNKVLMVVNF